MAGPRANQHALYDAQHAHISRLFKQEENTPWAELNREVDDALADQYRAQYEAIRAWDSGYEAEAHIQRGKDAVEDMRLVMDAEGRTAEEIEERLPSVIRMIAAVEGELTDGESEASDEEEEGKAVQVQEASQPAAPATKRRRTREATPGDALLPTSPATGNRRKQPARRAKSKLTQ
ncbi:hypothetical protein LTR85_010417 [Meristemomyces frigidus]|nr:hypothetical protein LTR85_010417 [Meristemomyces frigidus]